MTTNRSNAATALSLPIEGGEEVNPAKVRAVSLALAVFLCAAILFGLSQAQKVVRTSEPVLPDDLRAVFIPLPLPPPAPIQTVLENPPPPVDLTHEAHRAPIPDAVRVVAAPVATILEPDVRPDIEMVADAFKPAHGRGGASGELRQVYEKEEVDQAARPLYTVSPKIHPLSLSGTKLRRVLLLFVVETDGRPGELYLLQSVNAEVDRLVMAAVRDWKFRPGKKNKVPVRQWVQLPVVVTDGGFTPFQLH